MVDELTPNQELKSLLVRELARRLHWFSASYAAIAALFTAQPEMRSPLGWALTAILLALGVVRSSYARAVVRQACTAESRPARRFTGVTAVLGLALFAFLSHTAWQMNGSMRIEILVLVSVAALSGTSAGLYSPVPLQAWLHVSAQVLPIYAWSVFALPRYGWMLAVMVLIHATAVVLTVQFSNQYVRRILVAQLQLQMQRETLAQALDRAEEASNARMRFLANMSHEIRTPLNGILGLTELLGQEGLNQEQSAVLRALESSGQHLLAIVNDILDMAKVSSGKLEINKAAFDVKALLEDVTAPMRALADSKNLKLTTEIAQAPERVIGDAVRVRQVIANLVNNAIKFTERGEVKAYVTAPRKDWLRVEVTDTGIGISPEQVKRLFEEFYQVDSSMTRRFGGTGLGLAISRHLVELMSGQLRVESQPGVGSRFWFEIPAPCACPQTADSKTEVELTLPVGLRVLVVEDNPINRMMAERLLAKAGVQVDLAENGRIALERHTAEPYDVILMDCQMPEMDGYEATQRIRLLGGAAGRTCIIGVTANAFAEDEARCYQVGMDGYVAKPLSKGSLLAAMVEKLGPDFRPGAEAGVSRTAC